MLLGRFHSGDHVLADTEDGTTVIFKIVEDEKGEEPQKELAST
jgi:hypothetical protein